uniref:Uncharacterized protein n=1 Tax=Chrysotila carterae TaxID=13221 RepID=A0A6T0B621_CHRCT
MQFSLAAECRSLHIATVTVEPAVRGAVRSTDAPSNICPPVGVRHVSLPQRCVRLQHHLDQLILATTFLRLVTHEKHLSREGHCGCKMRSWPWQSSFRRAETERRESSFANGAA